MVAYLLSGKTGALLSQASTLNPQGQYGADVISRIQYVLDGGREEPRAEGEGGNGLGKVLAEVAVAGGRVAGYYGYAQAGQGKTQLFLQ